MNRREADVRNQTKQAMTKRDAGLNPYCRLKSATCSRLSLLAT